MVLGPILLRSIKFFYQRLFYCTVCFSLLTAGISRTFESESPAKLEPHRRGESTSPLHARARLLLHVRCNCSPQLRHCRHGEQQHGILVLLTLPSSDNASSMVITPSTVCCSFTTSPAEIARCYTTEGDGGRCICSREQAFVAWRGRKRGSKRRTCRRFDQSRGLGGPEEPHSLCNGCISTCELFLREKFNLRFFAFIIQ